MKVSRLVQVVDTHTAGEPTRIVVGGLPPLPPGTVGEKARWLAENHDGLRRLIVQEPRGHVDMFAAFLLPPSRPEANWGLIFMHGGGYLSMCGHGTIGAAAALRALGWLSGEEVAFDTPAGLVRCRLDREGNVTVRNVPAFYLGELSRGGLRVHLSYGGNLFALVDAGSCGIPLTPEALPEAVRLGLDIMGWANRKGGFRHPGTGRPLSVELVEFYREGRPPRNVVIFGEGQVDRSPCGTGTCAKMAFLYSQGRLGLGEPYRYQGILGTEFLGRLVGETQVGDRVAVVPEITGRAYVTGLGTLVLEEGDPFPEGFSLPRTSPGVARG